METKPMFAAILAQGNFEFQSYKQLMAFVKLHRAGLDPALAAATVTGI